MSQDLCKREDTPQYRAAYERGWRASQRYAASTSYQVLTPLERADYRGEDVPWYDGYNDHAADRPKWHLLRCQGCPDHPATVTADELTAGDVVNGAPPYLVRATYVVGDYVIARDEHGTRYEYPIGHPVEIIGRAQPMAAREVRPGMVVLIGGIGPRTVRTVERVAPNNPADLALRFHCGPETGDVQFTVSPDHVLSVTP